MPAKYEIGQLVRAKVGEFEWDCHVYSIGYNDSVNYDEPDYEYLVTNCPHGCTPLLWEYELSPVNAPLVLEEERSDDE